jgi:1,6-anhydro-N-acetylmuramate kinase
MDLEREADVERLLAHFHISVADTPVVICRGQTVLRNPTIDTPNTRIRRLCCRSSASSAQFTHVE